MLTLPPDECQSKSFEKMNILFQQFSDLYHQKYFEMGHVCNHFKNTFLSRNIDQNMLKHALLFWTKAVESVSLDRRRPWKRINILYSRFQFTFLKQKFRPKHAKNASFFG